MVFNLTFDRACTWRNTVGFEAMGKSKKGKTSKSGGDPVTRSSGLAEQMLENKTVRSKGRTKERQRQDEDETVCAQIPDTSTHAIS